MHFSDVNDSCSSIVSDFQDSQCMQVICGRGSEDLSYVQMFDPEREKSKMTNNVDFYEFDDVFLLNGQGRLYQQRVDQQNIYDSPSNPSSPSSPYFNTSAYPLDPCELNRFNTAIHSTFRPNNCNMSPQNVNIIKRTPVICPSSLPSSFQPPNLTSEPTFMNPRPLPVQHTPVRQQVHIFDSQSFSMEISSEQKQFSTVLPEHSDISYESVDLQEKSNVDQSSLSKVFQNNYNSSKHFVENINISGNSDPNPSYQKNYPSSPTSISFSPLSSSYSNSTSNNEVDRRANSISLHSSQNDSPSFKYLVKSSSNLNAPPLAIKSRGISAVSLLSSTLLRLEEGLVRGKRHNKTIISQTVAESDSALRYNNNQSDILINNNLKNKYFNEDNADSGVNDDEDNNHGIGSNDDFLECLDDLLFNSLQDHSHRKVATTEDQNQNSMPSQAPLHTHPPIAKNPLSLRGKAPSQLRRLSSISLPLTDSSIDQLAVSQEFDDMNEVLSYNISVDNNLSINLMHSEVDNQQENVSVSFSNSVTNYDEATNMKTGNTEENQYNITDISSRFSLLPTFIQNNFINPSNWNNHVNNSIDDDVTHHLNQPSVLIKIPHESIERKNENHKENGAVLQFSNSDAEYGQDEITDFSENCQDTLGNDSTNQHNKYNNVTTNCFNQAPSLLYLKNGEENKVSEQSNLSEFRFTDPPFENRWPNADDKNRTSYNKGEETIGQISPSFISKREISMLQQGSFSQNDNDMISVTILPPSTTFQSSTSTISFKHEKQIGNTILPFQTSPIKSSSLVDKFLNIGNMSPVAAGAAEKVATAAHALRNVFSFSHQKKSPSQQHSYNTHYIGYEDENDENESGQQLHSKALNYDKKNKFISVPSTEHRVNKTHSSTSTAQYRRAISSSSSLSSKSQQSTTLSNCYQQSTPLIINENVTGLSTENHKLRCSDRKTTVQSILTLLSSPSKQNTNTLDFTDSKENYDDYVSIISPV